MKDGYQKAMIAGAIAGVVDGIVSFISSIAAVWIGVYGAPFPPTPFFLILWLLAGSLPYNIFWGIIFGIAYAMTYDCLPGKGVKKGLFFALLFYWVLSNIRNAQIMATYGEVWWPKVQAWVGFFASVAYGLVLGALYKK